MRFSIASCAWSLPAPFFDGGEAYAGKSKLRVPLPGIEAEIKDKVVLDFGCGPGAEVKEMALLGAKRVIGLDISQKWLRVAREQAEKAGVATKREFASSVAIPSMSSFLWTPANILPKRRPSCRRCIHCSNPVAASLSALVPLGIIRLGAICFLSFLGPCFAEGRSAHSLAPNSRPMELGSSVKLREG